MFYYTQMPRPLQVNAAGTKTGILLIVTSNTWYIINSAKFFTEELRKVFVGMLGKCTKDDVTRMFQPYGPIEDLTMLQDREGISKRCAFIKFASRQQAQRAINEMHGSDIMPVSIRIE